MTTLSQPLGRPCDVAALGEPRGSFETFSTWVNKAQSWIGGIGAICVDAKGRACRIGADFHRARDEDAFPVTWYVSPPEASTAARGGLEDGVLLGVTPGPRISTALVRVGREERVYALVTHAELHGLNLVDAIVTSAIAAKVTRIVVRMPDDPSSRVREVCEAFRASCRASLLPMLTVSPRYIREDFGERNDVVTTALRARFRDPAAPWPARSSADQRAAAAAALVAAVRFL